MSLVTDLPPKENALFKRLRKCYEWKQYKQYKNGLKFAKQILSNPKFSDHAETLATKGLILSCMGKKEEAFELVHRGLRNNPKSHLCWHAYAILLRADRKYDEAIKCVRNALKCDKDNILYLRDLSIFQIQMRDLQGYRETRYQLLVLRPGQKVSWIGYAMTHHLTGDFDMALNVLEEFRKTQTVTKEHDYEHSELLSYQVWVMVEAGKLCEALEHLNKHQHHMLDKLFVQETRGEIFLKLSEPQRALQTYQELLHRNPENVEYYQRALQALPQQDADEEEFLRTCISDFPRALTPKLLLLQALQGDSFRIEADLFLRQVLRKGVPPTFKNLRALYSDPVKTQVLQELVEGYAQSLQQYKLFHPADQEEQEAPTSLLWSLYYLAQHYDHLHRYQKALRTIDQAIKHTMTLIELYIVKAKIYKHTGDLMGAVRCLDEAQSLDTADRYVNCKCTKYMLRAGLLDEALVMASKFTREGTSAMENLNEMQCMWFCIEVAQHYRRKGMYGEALKKCHEIDRHFSEIVEDQYEFHTYCMRKLTLRSYVELLRLEDSLRAHKFFSKTAQIAIEIYLHLHKHPLSDSSCSGDDHVDNLSAAEKKKLRNKQRKKEMQQQQKQQQQQGQQQKQQQQQQNSNRKNADADMDTHKEEELVPEKLARTEKPLEEALRFLRPLQIFSPHCISTHVLAFNVAFERGKVLLMLQAVKRGYAIDALHPGMHQCIVKFVHYVSQSLDEQEAVVAELLKMELQRMFAGRSARQLNEEYLRHHCHNNLPNLLAASLMHRHLRTGEETESLQMLMSQMTLTEQQTDVKHCQEVFHAMKEGSFGECEASMEQFKESFSQAFPFSTLLDLVPGNTNNNTPDITISTTTTAIIATNNNDDTNDTNSTHTTTTLSNGTN